MPFGPDNAVLCFCETNAELYFNSLCHIRQEICVTPQHPERQFYTALIFTSMVEYGQGSELIKYHSVML